MHIDNIPFEKLPGMKSLLKLASVYYEGRLKRRVKSGNYLPKHIGIILDGNRRFAKNNDLLEENGHKLGAKKLEEVLEWAFDLGIQHVTVYAFSKENFKRNSEEVSTLMELFKLKFVEVSESEKIHERGVRVRAIGDLSALPEDVKEAIFKAEKSTEDYENYSLNIAVDYGGRAELAKAVRDICKDIEDGRLDSADVDEDLIESNLYTSGLPDPDLIIRTSGEERLSGFLLWQSAYSELYFCEANWPSFDKINFLRAIRNYQGRERRYGE